MPLPLVLEAIPLPGICELGEQEIGHGLALQV